MTLLYQEANEIRRWLPDIFLRDNNTVTFSTKKRNLF